MRFYTFSNMYLSQLQVGLQSAHCLHELFLKYDPFKVLVDANETSMLYEWASDHKTMILLNGGYSENLRVIINLFDNPENTFPWASFNEGDDALDGALTCVGIVLPERIYETASAIRNNETIDEIVREYGGWAPMEGEHYKISKWEYELCLELNKYGLA